MPLHRLRMHDVAMDSNRRHTRLVWIGVMTKADAIHLCAFVSIILGIAITLLMQKINPRQWSDER